MDNKSELFLFYPNLDSPGNDIAHDSNTEMVLQNPDAIGFNTNGWIKSSFNIKNLKPFGSSSSDGTYLKNPCLFSSTLDQKIPKIIHQIWIGPKKSPIYMEQMQKSYVEAGWKYILWDEAKIANHKFINHHQFKTSPEYCGKADQRTCR